MQITIAQIKEIREQLGATHLVIFAVDSEGQQYVATHGQTQKQAKEAATAGNKLKSALGWPEDLCKSKPLPRVHENCAYYKQDWGYHCFNGWSGDGKSGYCHLEPTRTKQEGEGIACRYFEPRT